MAIDSSMADLELLGKWSESRKGDLEPDHGFGEWSISVFLGGFGWNVFDRLSSKMPNSNCLR